jgi:hypothetical protein
MTARVIERGIWWWVVGAPGGAWYGYPFASRSDAEAALQMETAA